MTGSEAYGEAWMKRIGAKSLDQLRSMPWEDLIKDEQSGGVGGFWPCVDGYVITDDQYKLYEAGNYNKERCSPALSPSQSTNPT